MPKHHIERWPGTRIFNHKRYTEQSGGLLSKREADNLAAAFRKGAKTLYRGKYSTRVVHAYNRYEKLHYWLVYARKLL